MFAIYSEMAFYLPYQKSAGSQQIPEQISDHQPRNKPNDNDDRGRCVLLPGRLNLCTRSTQQHTPHLLIDLHGLPNPPNSGGGGLLVLVSNANSTGTGTVLSIFQCPHHKEDIMYRRGRVYLFWIFKAGKVKAHIVTTLQFSGFIFGPKQASKGQIKPSKRIDFWFSLSFWATNRVGHDTARPNSTTCLWFI